MRTAKLGGGKGDFTRKQPDLLHHLHSEDRSQLEADDRSQLRAIT